MIKMLKKVLSIPDDATKRDVEGPLFYRVATRFAICAIGIILDILFLVITREYKYFFILMAVIALYAFYQYTLLIRLQYGDYITIEGPCYCTQRKVVKFAGVQRYGNAEARIHAHDGKVYAFPFTRPGGYEDGTIIRVYCPTGGILERDQGAYVIPSPYCIEVVKYKEHDGE